MFSNIEFFCWLIVLLIPAVFIGIREQSLRWYRDILTIFFLIYLFKNNALSFVYLMLYIIIALYVTKIMLYYQKKNPRSEFVCGTCVAIVILPLILSKYGNYISIGWFSFLGVSYICFRVVQILLEIYDGLIEEISTISFIEFLIFFPAISSGPIDRSRRFLEDNGKIWNKNEYLELLGEGIQKIIVGIFYKFVLSMICFNTMSKIGIAGGKINLDLIKYTYLYGFYLFFDFAGYSLMAIGTAYVLGIRLPDNFNKPFLSIDIKDFWNRWHISLSHWFRDFLFTRLLMKAIRNKCFSDRVKTAAVVYIVNMMVMGIWHGNGVQYLLYGLYHGLLLAINEFYQKTKFYKKYKKNNVYKIASWAVTINLVMFGFLIFSGYFNKV